MTEHSKEPWHTDKNMPAQVLATGPNGYAIHVSGCTCIADAERIVACVNALAGLNPEAIPKVVGLVKRLRRVLSDAHCGQSGLHDTSEWSCIACDLLRETDTALAELKA